jgi:hypothetical protein
VIYSSLIWALLPLPLKDNPNPKNRKFLLC